MRYYYEMWADAMEFVEKTDRPLPKEERRIAILIGLSVAQGSNLTCILILLSYFYNFSILFDINVFPGNYLDHALSGFISLVLPFVLINYFMFFYKKYHLKYKENRKVNTNGKAFFFYFFISQGLFLALGVLGKILN